MTTPQERRDSMASQAADAEDVNDFLARIKEMGSKRDQEDEERNKRLEEEILQGRRERAARRAGKVARLPVFPRTNGFASSHCIAFPSFGVHTLYRIVALAYAVNRTELIVIRDPRPLTSATTHRNYLARRGP